MLLIRKVASIAGGPVAVPMVRHVICVCGIL